MMRRLSALALGAVIAVALIPQPGFAHAAYKDSEPKDGETVSSPPSRVTAEFTEAVVSDSYLQVFDACGRQVDNRDSIVVHDRITVSMSGEARGVYVVRFNVVSAVDGHPTVGSFDFTSSGGAECPGEKPAAGQGPTSGDEDAGSGSATGSSGRDSASVSSASQNESRTQDARREMRGERAGNRDGLERNRGGRTRGGNAADGADDAFVAASPAGERKASIWSGIPMNWFAVGLVIAALVGAAGGLVYAGIVDPRRV